MHVAQGVGASAQTTVKGPTHFVGGCMQPAQQSAFFVAACSVVDTYDFLFSVLVQPRLSCMQDGSTVLVILAVTA